MHESQSKLKSVRPRPTTHDQYASLPTFLVSPFPAFSPYHQTMVKENSLPFKFKKDLPARIGLLRRDAPAGLAEVGALGVKLKDVAEQCS